VRATVRTTEALDLSLRVARGRPVLIEFFAEWCAACRVFERDTLPAAEVVSELRRFAWARVDATDDVATRSLTARFAVEHLPTVLLLSSSGELLQRIDGAVTPTELVTELRRAR
jgi:thiol:disulfide interchange protein DsbD